MANNHFFEARRFSYYQLLAEVHRLRQALNRGTGRDPVCFALPKILSSRAENFDLPGPQVRNVWINYWVLNMVYEITTQSAFGVCSLFKNTQTEHTVQKPDAFLSLSCGPTTDYTLCLQQSLRMQQKPCLSNRQVKPECLQWQHSCLRNGMAHNI
jgi:hypothetical protein